MDWGASWGIIEHPWLRLEPTNPGHAEDLRKTVDEGTFAYFTNLQPKSLGEGDFAAFVEELCSMPNQRPYTMRFTDTGEAVGCSSFMDIRAMHRGLEIGCTWIAAPWRGTFVNPAAKLTMLTFAFERLDAVRVQLKCDARNAPSSAAILKLGAQFEGRLRKHVILPDGFVRDTLMYSIVPDEWPEVRDRLDQRLLGLN